MLQNQLDTQTSLISCTKKFIRSVNNDIYSIDIEWLFIFKTNYSIIVLHSINVFTGSWLQHNTVKFSHVSRMMLGTLQIGRLLLARDTIYPSNFCSRFLWTLQVSSVYFSSKDNHSLSTE